MGETFIQLPTDGLGKQFRTETGDATNAIPTGLAEEVVIQSDAQGLFAGDGRMRPLPVTEQTMQEVLLEVRRLTLMLSLAFNADIPSAGDALALTGG